MARGGDAGEGKRHLGSSPLAIDLRAKARQPEIQGEAIDMGLSKEIIRQSAKDGPAGFSAIEIFYCIMSQYFLIDILKSARDGDDFCTGIDISNSFLDTIDLRASNIAAVDLLCRQIGLRDCVRIN